MIRLVISALILVCGSAIAAPSLKNPAELSLSHNILDRVKFANSHKSDNGDRDGLDILFCSACNVVVNLFFNSMANNATTEEIVDGVVGVCLSLGLYSELVCRGVVVEAVSDFVYIYENKALEAGNICGLIFQEYNCALSDISALEWTIEPPAAPKPPVESPSPIEPGSPTLKVLHISDFHWDPEYLPGSLAACGDPLCCRAGSGVPANESEMAGYWGDYRSCDLPLWTLKNAMENIAAAQQDIDFIIWTGDLPPHDVWETNQIEHTTIVQEMTNLLVQYFPGVPVYGAIGNHESHPINAYPVPEIEGENSVTWLYNAVADAWSVWLPEETLTTLRYGGYYSVLAKPGLRIISANFNYCYTLNWWILYESNDPANGLQYIQSELVKAEEAGEKVFLISHIIPGRGDCWQIYTRELNKVINRFENTVAAQFYGHSHNDEFKIFFSLDDPSRAISVAWVGPSLTTYSDVNPGYKVYTIDGVREGSTFGMLEHEAWIMNLTQANIGPSTPEWYKLYNGRDTFGLSSLSPQDMASLVDRLMVDDNLFQTYYSNYVKNGDPSLDEGCDADCKSKLLCSMVTSDFSDQTKCLQILAKLEKLQA